MTTEDRSGIPHELRGFVGQVTSGAPITPALAPSPGPGALAGSSPGINGGVLTPIASPTLPDPSDPHAMTLLLSRMANELFGGSSVVPVPSPQQVQTGAAPGSPGISPSMVPAPQGMPSDPTAAAVPQPTAASPSPAVFGAAQPSSPFAAGLAPTATPYGGGSSGSPHYGSTHRAGAPASSHDGSAHRAGAAAPSHDGSTHRAGAPAPSHDGSAHRSAPSRPGASSSYDPSASSIPTSSGSLATFAPTAGLPAGVPTAPRTASSHAPGVPTGLGSSHSAPSAPTAPTTPPPSLGSSHGAPTMPTSNPFTGELALDALLGGFDTSTLETMRIPIVDATGADLAPYFIPGADAVKLDTQLGEPSITGGDARHDALIRDLGGAAFDPYAVRRDFPILDERIRGKRLVWLDNAATTQKPRAVIDRLTHYYEHENSNVHRGAHTLAARATDAFESGREATRRFLNAGSTQEIVFVRGATEGINLVAQSWGRRHVNAGDEILITHLEHHANIVPWQLLCADRGARLRVAPVDDRGDVILEEFDRLLNPRTRLVAFPQVSNALGTITPAREMVALAHRHGARVLVDGAQAVSHMRVDVQQLDCDWYVFSGHKVFAPTGIGALFGKRDVLEQMPPWQGGGNMIQDVTFERTVYNPPPWRFEAGTGSIGDAAGLGAALEYVMRIGIDVIDRYEHDLLGYATQRLATVPGLTMIGTSPNKAGVLSFVLDGQRTEDVGAALDQDAIAVRSGHHCAQPIHRRYGLEGTVRASLAFYNVCEDIDALVEALHRLQAGRG